MTINCKGNLIDLNTPKIMGVLNLTPDSFYDGGKYKNQKEIITQVTQMISQGATFIDIGAYSSRPGAEHVSETEELRRMTPIVALLIKDKAEVRFNRSIEVCTNVKKGTNALCGGKCTCDFKFSITKWICT